MIFAKNLGHWHEWADWKKSVRNAIGDVKRKIGGLGQIKREITEANLKGMVGDSG